MADPKKSVLTDIEKLAAKHPGLRQAVDLRLDGGASCEQIAQEIQVQYNELIPEKTISNYRLRRWLPEKTRVKRLCELASSVLEITRKYGKGQVAEAFIFERLAQANEAGEKVSLAVILRELREWNKTRLEEQRLALDVGRLEHDNRKLQVTIDQLNQEKAETAQKAETLIARRSKELSAEVISEIRQTVYGLPPEAVKVAQEAAVTQ